MLLGAEWDVLLPVLELAVNSAWTVMQGGFRGPGSFHCKCNENGLAP